MQIEEKQKISLSPGMSPLIGYLVCVQLYVFGGTTFLTGCQVRYLERVMCIVRAGEGLWLPSALQEDCVHRTSQAEPLAAVINLLCPHFVLLILSLTSCPLVTYNSLLAIDLKSHSVVFYFNFRDVYKLGTQIGHSIFFFIVFIKLYIFLHSPSFRL